MSQPTEKTFKIEGMHCTSCAMTIDWEIEDVEGVKAADTSYAKATTTVRLEKDTVPDEAILAAIKRAGFEARPA